VGGGLVGSGCWGGGEPRRGLKGGSGSELGDRLKKGGTFHDGLKVSTGGTKPKEEGIISEKGVGG